MKNQSSLPKLSSLLALALVATIYCGFWAVANDAKASQNPVIDEMYLDMEVAEFIPMSSVDAGSKEKISPVNFPHAVHTKAIEEAGLNCGACHNVDEDGFLDTAFKDAHDYSGSDLKNYYHDTCVACHAKAPAGKNAPMLASCRSCHSEAN